MVHGKPNFAILLNVIKNAVIPRTYRKIFELLHIILPAKVTVHIGKYIICHSAFQL